MNIVHHHILSMRLLIVITLFVPGFAGATSIQVSPPWIDLHVPSGQSRSAPISFKNTGGADLMVTAVLVDWVPSQGAESGSWVSAPPGTDPHSIVPRCTVQPSQMRVAGNKAGSFLVTVSAPPGENRGYYARVVMTGSPIAQSTGTAIGIGARVNVGLMVRSGNSQPKLAATIAGIRMPTPTENLALTLGITNNSNVHGSVEGYMELLGPMKDFIGHMLPEDRKILILPGQTRNVQFIWGGTLPPAHYEAIASLYYGKGGVALTQHSFDIQPMVQQVLEQQHVKKKKRPRRKKTKRRNR